MPLKPTEQTDRVPMMGSNYQMRLYTGADDPNRMLYMVVMQEFPRATGNLEPTVRLEKFMEGFKEGFAKSIGDAGLKVEIVPDRDLDLKSHMGRQYKLSVSESRGLVRAFDGPSRMYILLVLGGDESNTNVKRFFDSFELVSAPAPVPQPSTSN
jgi:hypothetical protein